jgi:hypothetical protein
MTQNLNKVIQHPVQSMNLLLQLSLTSSKKQIIKMKLLIGHDNSYKQKW